MKYPGMPQTGMAQAILGGQQLLLARQKMQQDAKARRQQMGLDIGSLAVQGLGIGGRLYEGAMDRDSAQATQQMRQSHERGMEERAIEAGKYGRKDPYADSIDAALGAVTGGERATTLAALRGIPNIDPEVVAEYEKQIKNRALTGKAAVGGKVPEMLGVLSKNSQFGRLSKPGIKDEEFGSDAEFVLQNLIDQYGSDPNALAAGLEAMAAASGRRTIPSLPQDIPQVNVPNWGGAWAPTMQPSQGPMQSEAQWAKRDALRRIYQAKTQGLPINEADIRAVRGF